MATVKLDREEQPDYNDAQDMSYEDEGQPDFDEGAQVAYDDNFPDADSGDDGSQEWPLRMQEYRAAPPRER